MSVSALRVSGLTSFARAEKRLKKATGRGFCFVNQLKFTQRLLGGGYVVIPSQLIEKMQSLNLTPENLGYLVLGLARCQSPLSTEELAKDKWVKWCLSEGWAQWVKSDNSKSISFDPLWARLYSVYEEAAAAGEEVAVRKAGEFDYGKIMKWLDYERGTLSIGLKEKQVIQEFNLKYGWSTEFILIFLQLAFERGLKQVQAYQPISKRVFESGIDGVNDLVAFMNDLDWVLYKVAEVKKSIGQYGGVTRPQREMYLKWNRQWKFSHELIMRASDETVRTNSPSFKYIDAILKDWHNKGVKDVHAAEKSLAEHNQARMQQHKPASGAKRLSKAGNRDLDKLYGFE
jgi:DnaD/phage-associated family protein